MTDWRNKLIPGLCLLVVVGVGAWFRLWAIERLPPALQPDEGYYGLDALYIMQGHWMVFAPENNGREALYMILAAGVFKIFGSSVFVFRVFTACLGVLTLVAVYWLGWEASPQREQAPWVGLLAAGSLASLLMHVIINRNAMRVNLLPLVTALAGAALLCAFRVRRIKWFILAGGLLGLSVYVYPTARLLPVWVVVAFGLWWPPMRKEWRSHVLGFVSVVGVAIIVFIPLGSYFLQHPEFFMRRAEMLIEPTAWGRSLEEALLLFHVQGDDILNFNLPNRPVFDLPQAIAFWIGMCAILTGDYKRFGWAVVVWFVVGLLPAALTSEDSSYSHAFGMIPPLAVLMGYGYVAASTWLVSRLQQFTVVSGLAKLLGVGLVLVGLGYSSWRTYHDYFTEWANRSDLGLAYRADLMRIDQYTRNPFAEAEIFLSPYREIESPLRFMRAGDTSQFHPYDGHYCIPLGNTASQPLAYLTSEPESLAILHKYYPTGEESVAPEFGIFSVSAGTPIHFPPDTHVQAIWAEQLALIQAEAWVMDVQTVKVELVWQTRPEPAALDYHRFVHMVTTDPTQPGGVRLWAQNDDTLCHGTHPVVYWQTNEHIVDTLTLTTPTPWPTGTYRLVVGLYQNGASARLAVDMANWPIYDEAVTFATITIQ